MIPPNDPEARAIFQKILANPLDDTNRLVYADRLNELDELGAVCVECTYCEGSGEFQWFQDDVLKVDGCDHCGATGTMIDRTNAAHAALIREMVTTGWIAAFDAGKAMSLSILGTPLHLAPALPGVALTVRRGFVDEIACTLERFTELFGTCDGTSLTLLEYVGEMRAKYPWPLTKITLTDRTPSGHMNRRYYWRQWDYENIFPEDLPKFLHDELGTYGCYSSETDAYEDLSRVAVSWFRKVCGFNSKMEVVQL